MDCQSFITIIFAMVLFDPDHIFKHSMLLLLLCPYHINQLLVMVHLRLWNHQMEIRDFTLAQLFQAKEKSLLEIYHSSLSAFDLNSCLQLKWLKSLDNNWMLLFHRFADSTLVYCSRFFSTFQGHLNQCRKCCHYQNYLNES